jgi:hypothetical protein
MILIVIFVKNIIMRICTKCKVEKNVDDFNKDKSKKSGLVSHCKSCCVKRTLEWKSKNLDKSISYGKEYKKNNKDKINEYKRNHRASNSEAYKERYVNNQENIRNRYREWWKSKYYSDELFRFKNNTRNLISRSFKRSCLNTHTKPFKTEELLGCTIMEFRSHIEALFVEGMSFDNYGKWHFDHIIPISLANSMEDVIRLSHYTNFQPLWAIDNLRKSNK